MKYTGPTYRHPYEATLKYMNKGFSLKDSYEQLERLNKAGIKHIDILIFGGAGRRC